MGQVWELKLKPAEKYVLLAYVDHADHEGKNIHPSQALIAWKTGYTLRQIRTITARLEALKLLKPVVKEAGKVTHYETAFENATRLPVRKVGKVFTSVKISPVKNTTQKAGGTGEIATHKRRTEPSYIEPSKKNKSPKLTKAQIALNRLNGMDDTQSILYDVFIEQFGYQPEYDDDFETDITRLSTHGISATQLRAFIETTTKSEWWVKNRNGAAVRVKYAADNISQMAKPATPAPKSTNGTKGNLQNSARLHGLVGEVIE